MIEDSPSFNNQFTRTHISRRAHEVSDMAFATQQVPGIRQEDEEQSFWLNAQHRPIARSGDPESSKSQQLSQTMNHMYY